MTVTLKCYERILIRHGEDVTLTIVEVRNPAGYWNGVGIYIEPGENTPVFTSLRSTPTNVVDEPFLILFLNLTTFQNQPVFFNPQRR